MERRQRQQRQRQARSPAVFFLRAHSALSLALPPPQNGLGDMKEEEEKAPD